MAGISKLARLTLVVLVGFVVFAQAAIAKPQPGDLDHSFGSKGIVHTRVPGSRGAYWTSVAIGRSNRIVASASNPGGLFARYKANGELDPSFSGDGVQRVDFSGGASVALGKGGAVTAAGPTCSRVRCQFKVARLTADGELDPGFGDGGEATFGGSFDGQSTPMAIDSRGRTVVAGTGCRKGDCTFQLIRVKPNGELDRSFGKDGRVATHIDHDHEATTTFVGGLAIDSHGRMVAAGSASKGRVVLVRYKKNGQRDRTFGHHGIVLKRLGPLGGVNGIAITPKDKIVAAGPSTGNANKWALARFGRKGGLNRSFGDGGQTAVNIPCSGNSDPAAVALDSQNRIVVTGRPCYSVARFQPNGKLNRSFGHHGIASKDFGHNFPQALAIDSRDRPVVAGAWPGGIPLTLARFIG